MQVVRQDDNGSVTVDEYIIFILRTMGKVDACTHITCMHALHARTPVQMHACMHTCPYMHIHACRCAYMHACMHTHKHAHTHARTHTCTQVDDETLGLLRDQFEALDADGSGDLDGRDVELLVRACECESM